MQIQRYYRFAFLAVTLTLLSACSVVGPEYVRPDLPVLAQWNNSQNSSPREDLSHWWQKLGDATLSDLIEQALQNSPDIRSAQARLLEARARRDLAGANRLPTLSGSISGSRTRSSKAVGSGQTSNLFQAGFDASWEPDVFGGLQSAVDAAQADAEASRASLHAVQTSLVAEVALNYAELRSSQARLAIARDNLATQEETLQITDWRQQAGLATALDVEQAHTNLEQTRASIPTLNTNLTEAENRLAILLGKAPGALHQVLSPVAPLPKVTERVALGIPADTLRQRPDVQAAERTLAAETARIGEKTADLYPSFSLSGTFGWKALTLGALGGPGTVASSLLASATQNIFDAGRIRSSIRIQTAVQQQALAAYEKAVLTALEDVENALAAYANSHERQTALRFAVQSARNAATLAHQQYQSGLVDFQKVLDTERTRLSVEDSLASAELDGLNALISLYKALGGGWQDGAATEESEKS